jgi:hypothetical protein
VAQVALLCRGLGPAARVAVGHSLVAAGQTPASWSVTRQAVRALARLVPGLRPAPRNPAEVALHELEDIWHAAQADRSHQAVTVAYRAVLAQRAVITAERAEAARPVVDVLGMSPEEFLEHHIEELKAQSRQLRERDQQAWMRMMTEIRTSKAELTRLRTGVVAIESPEDIEHGIADDLCEMGLEQTTRVVREVLSRMPDLRARLG